MPRPDDASVVIVGGGPAGLGVAGALARRGLAAVVLVGFRESVRGQLYEASREAQCVAAALAHR